MKIYRYKKTGMLAVASPTTRRGWWLSSGAKIHSLLNLEDWEEVVLLAPESEAVQTWGGGVLATIQVSPGAAPR